MKYYIYLLKDNDIPFYVGKGTNKRMYQHLSDAKHDKRKSPTTSKIKSMLSAGREIQYEKIFETDDLNEAYIIETATIKKYGRIDNGTGILTNLTDGGEGPRGYVPTIEHKKNLSKTIKKAIKEGRFKPGLQNKGTSKPPITEEHRKKLSEATLRFWESEKGLKQKKKWSKEKTGKKRKLTDEARKKMGDSRRGKKYSKEERLEMSRRAKKYWENKKEDK